MALKPKQELFVAEYLVDLNATAAAARAGYKHPNKQGPRLLVNVGVAARIQELKRQRSERVQADADQVLREQLWLAHSDIADILDFSGEEPQLRPAREIPKHAHRAIASMKVRRYTDGRG
jgi:phage terminase small subunit